MTGQESERFPKAHQQLRELQEALARAGVMLPGLRLDPWSFRDVDGLPVFDLGRCNVQTAKKLIESLKGESS